MRLRFFSFFAAATFLSAGILSTSSYAQDSTGLNLATAYDLGVRSMENGDYDVGMKAVDDIIAFHGASGLTEFGPVFGHFYYLKGMLHLKKKEYKAAIFPLKTCFENFNNDSLKEAVEDDPRLPNRFLVHARFQWGNALMAMKKWPEAVVQFEDTLRMEEIYEPKIPRLSCQVNLARCYINANQVQKGKDFLVKLIDGDTITDRQRRTLFMILASDWSIKVKFPEMRQIVHKYRDLMARESVVGRYRKQNAIFHSLAAKGREAGEPIRALLWYSMMVHPGDVSKYYTQRILETEGKLKHFEERLKAPKANAEKLQAEIDRLTLEIETLTLEIPKQRTQLSDMLLGIGASHYLMGSLAGARSAYLELAEHFPEHKERAIILHNLVTTAVNLSLWKEGYKYGMMFFKEFPDHRLMPTVARVLVEVIFLQAEYQEAYDISIDVRKEMTAGDEIRDVPDFVTGGSLYHLARYEEAEAELEAYLKNYPEAKRLEAVKFYLGATKVNLFKWAEAAARMDEFLVEFPESELRPTGLYISGLSHLVLEEYGPAYARIVELQAKFPQNEMIPASWNVKGDILSGQGKDFDTVVPCYIEAVRLWEEGRRGDAEVAGYAHRQLVSECSGAKKWEDACKYFDHFKENYSQTSWRVDVNIAAIQPLAELDRKPEAKAILETFVNEFGDVPGTTELDEMFGAYTSFLRDNYPIEEMLEALKNFPSTIKPPPPALRAWMIMGGVEAMEQTDPKKYKDDIQQSYFRLNALYNSNGKDLSNYTLVRLARFNMNELKNVVIARKILDFILKERPEGDAVGFALIDTAKMDSESDDPTVLQSALNKFDRVFNEMDNPKMKEEATLGRAKIFEKLKDWVKAQGEWEKYLSNSGWRLARAEANLGYANALDKQEKEVEAIKAYVAVYSNFPGHLDQSTRAYLRAAEIMRSRGAELDALKILQDMLKRMGHHDHPGVKEAQEKFNKWRAEYIAKSKNK